jgi:hypothetical protein
MTDPTTIADRTAGPVLDPDERPASNGKRWAILIGFAAVVSIAAASVNHRSDKPAEEPPAAAAAKQQPPGSTNAVLPQGAPAAKSGG